MDIKRFIVGLVVVGSALCAAGCDASQVSDLVTQARDAVTTGEASDASSFFYWYRPYGAVQYAPPAPRAEVIPVAPSRRHFWVRGHHHWTGRRYEWVGGHWDTVRSGHTYVSGHWDRMGGRWYYEPGHWRPN